VGKNYDVPAERQAAYYIGMLMLVIGLILFISPMCTAVDAVRESSDSFLDKRTGNPMLSSEPGAMFQTHRKVTDSLPLALVGMGLFAVGAILMSVGRSGPAGSGLVLNPRQEVEDLEPFSRAQGRMLGQMLDEALPSDDSGSAIKVRCRHCRALNDEHDKFCGQCGQEL